MELEIQKVDSANRKEIPKDNSSLGFGQKFSDHMFMMEYERGKGWHSPRIEPYKQLQLDPAAMVLHYGQEVFEGMKAYRGKDDGLYLFRYEDNLRRFNRSCDRMVIPPIDIPFVANAWKELVRLEKEWIPRSPGCALYLRPTVIAIDPFLGVKPSERYLFYIICGPVGAYYPEGFNPVSIYVSDQYVRAVRGGIGEAKTGGNYAASLLAQMEAKEKGFSQVLWLDAIERKYIEEVGTMNIFFKFGDEVVTSPLTGSILPGITRDSVIQLLKKWGVKVTERLFTIEDVLKAQSQGSLSEVFGSGTAAIISPVGSIRYKDKDFQIGDGKTGQLSQKVYDHLLALQYGEAEDSFGWIEKIG